MVARWSVDVAEIGELLVRRSRAIGGGQFELLSLGEADLTLSGAPTRGRRFLAGVRGLGLMWARSSRVPSSSGRAGVQGGQGHAAQLSCHVGVAEPGAVRGGVDQPEDRVGP